MAGGGWWVESPKRGCSYSLNGSFQRQFAPLCRLRRHLPHTGGDRRDRSAREKNGDRGPKAKTADDKTSPHCTGLNCPRYPIGRAASHLPISLLVGGGEERSAHQSKRSSESFAVTNGRQDRGGYRGSREGFRRHTNAKRSGTPDWKHRTPGRSPSNITADANHHFGIIMPMTSQTTSQASNRPVPLTPPVPRAAFPARAIPLPSGSRCRAAFPSRPPAC